MRKIKHMTTTIPIAEVTTSVITKLLPRINEPSFTVKRNAAGKIDAINNHFGFGAFIDRK